jgi:hypothetical protein
MKMWYGLQSEVWYARISVVLQKTFGSAASHRSWAKTVAARRARVDVIAFMISKCYESVEKIDQ